MEKYVSVNQYEGGYLVVTDGKTFIATSLNKVMKLVREYLSSGVEDTDAE
jgi:hypothetical protein